MRKDTTSIALIVASAATVIVLFMGISVRTWKQRSAEEIEDLRQQLGSLEVLVASSTSFKEENSRQLQQPSFTCTDDTKWSFINKKDTELKCVFIAKNPNKRCKKVGLDNRSACEACCKTCSDAAVCSSPPQNCGCSDSFTYASDFDVVGDSFTDDTMALQAAIDSAVSNMAGGGTVLLPRGIFYTTSTLVIPGGITLKGQGYGSSPLAIKFDAGSSVIAYCGSNYAIKINGHAASLQDVAVYDWQGPVGDYCRTVKAAGGVLIEGDGKLVESVTMSNILIYWFMGGTSLTLSAKNAGGVAFCNFQNIRIRHAHTGLLLTVDATSFVK